MGSRRGHNEGSIYQRESDGKWVGSVHLGYGPEGKRQRKAIYGNTRKEVADRLKTILANQKNGLPINTNERLTIKQFLTDWLKVVKTEVRGTTYVQYEVSVRCHLIPKLGRVRVVELTPQHIREFVADRQAAGKSPRTANLARAVLRRALETAVEDGLIYRNPARVIRHKGSSTQPKFQPTYLDEDQARTLLEAVRGHRLEAFYSVALALGLRRGEGLGLRWCDVDFEKSTIHVCGSLLRVGKDTPLQRLETKTSGSTRTVRVPQQLIDTLRFQKARQQAEKQRAKDKWKGNEWDLVFTSEVGTGIEPRNINRHFKELLKSAGLPHIRLHDCRHTAAVLMLVQGIPLKVVSEILGHSRTSTTADIYAHVIPRQEQEAADKMGSLLWGNAPTGTTGKP